MPRLSQKAITTHIDPIVSGLYKAISAIPTIANQTLAYWQDKIGAAYNEHLPFFRRTVLRKVWATDDELESFEVEVAQKIAQYQQHPSIVRRTTLELEPNYSVSGISFTQDGYDSYVIYFGGVSYLWQSYFDILNQLHTTLKSNVLAYNYRGCADDAPVDPTEEQILADGVKLVEKLLQEGIPAKKITFWGRSLGGGISICLAAMLAKRGIVVNAINERSFRSLSWVVKESVPESLQKGVQHIEAIAKSFKWQLNAEEAMHELKGNLMIIYHEDDKTIPLAASFFAGSNHTPPLHLTLHTVKMTDGSQPLVQPKTVLTWFSRAHCRGFTQDELHNITKIFNSWK